MTNRLLPIVALCLLAPACTLLNNEEGSTGTLVEGRRMWQAQGIDDYTFTYVRSCECLPEMAGPFDVTVRRGIVAEVSYQGGPVDPTSRTFYTIDALFALIEEASDLEADRIDVTYHPAFGYPTEIYIDYEVDTADEEAIITVTAFETQG